MQIELSSKEFRSLLDMVYIGNWVLNSTRGADRFQVYDDLESKLFALCPALSQPWEDTVVPSKAYTEGGIHEAIAFYENYAEIIGRMDRYMSEFEVSGLDHLVLED